MSRHPETRRRSPTSLPNPTPVISVRGLRKSYGDREVVRGVSFDVAAGECFGLLGHNGAGKTTTIEILEGYLPRDGGSVSARDRADVRRPAFTMHTYQHLLPGMSGAAAERFATLVATANR